jgi:hypothetical protein
LRILTIRSPIFREKINLFTTRNNIYVDK